MNCMFGRWVDQFRLFWQIQYLLESFGRLRPEQMASVLVETVKKHFQEKFDPSKYLSECFKTPGTPENKRRDEFIATMHEAFKQRSAKLAQQHDVRVLDYGCGPVVCNVISAAGLPQVTEIVMTDYTDSCVDALRQWLSKNPSAFDWSPYFRYVVQTLEGKTDDEVAEREERVRSLVKLARCDITADPLIESGFEGPYDVVIAFMLLENCCSSIAEYRERLLRFSSLIKPGGVLMLLDVIKPSDSDEELATYQVGSEHFPHVRLSLEVVTDALKNASFTKKHCEKYWNAGPKDFVFICAEKVTQSN